MRLLSVLLLFQVIVMASASNNIIAMYNKGEFRSACLDGAKILREHKDDVGFVNAYAIACIKSDFIDLATNAVMYLRSDKASRANSSYILTLALQKKLLLHSLADSIDLEDALLPNTSHILSKVYNVYASKQYKTVANGVIEMNIDSKVVRLDSYYESGHFKVRIRQYAGSNLENEHIYW